MYWVRTLPVGVLKSPGNVALLSKLVFHGAETANFSNHLVQCCICFVYMLAHNAARKVLQISLSVYCTYISKGPGLIRTCSMLCQYQLLHPAPLALFDEISNLF
jgi:hypothetical protein